MHCYFLCSVLLKSRLLNLRVVTCTRECACAGVWRARHGIRSTAAYSGRRWVPLHDGGANCCTEFLLQLSFGASFIRTNIFHTACSNLPNRTFCRGCAAAATVKLRLQIRTLPRCLREQKLLPPGMGPHEVPCSGRLLMGSRPAYTC